MYNILRFNQINTILDYLLINTQIDELPVGACLINNNNQVKKYTWNYKRKHAERFFHHKELKNQNLIITLEPCSSCIIYLCHSGIKNIYFGTLNHEYVYDIFYFLNSIKIQKPKIFNMRHKQSSIFLQDFFYSKRMVV